MAVTLKVAELPSVTVTSAGLAVIAAGFVATESLAADEVICPTELLAVTLNKAPSSDSVRAGVV